jgi:hypothetical protein
LINFRVLQNGSRDSSAGIVTRLRAGRPEFGSRQGEEIFLYSTLSRRTLEPLQSPIKWVPGVNMQGHEADHSSSSEVKNGGAIPPLPHMPS